MNYLSTKYAHPRDTRITFDEGPHIYTIDGIDNSIANYTSVTTWIHSHFEKFDADTIIKNMMASEKWSVNKYFGKTSDEIKEMWRKNGEEASSAGTKLHYDIECYYNNCPTNDNTSIEYTWFQNFVQKHKHLVPYRTEWIVFDEELKLAGSIDMVFENEDGTLSIYDWKRSKGIQKTNSWNKYSHTEVISHLPDCNYWHYSLQLNIYKAILERQYNKKVTELNLVCLHPNNSNQNYQKISVCDLQSEVNDLFEYRKKQLQQT